MNDPNHINTPIDKMKYMSWYLGRWDDAIIMNPTITHSISQ